LQRHDWGSREYRHTGHTQPIKAAEHWPNIGQTLPACQLVSKILTTVATKNQKEMGSKK